VAYSIHSRRKKAALISDWLVSNGCRTSMFVGALGEEDAERHSNIIEDAVEKQTDVLLGFNVYPRTTRYPFLVADARCMPFPDACVDVALASAIVEHVGDRRDQERFVAEHLRGARCWVITTPNRWFPVESHTSALFKHWLPSWRASREEFTRLLSLREFRALLPAGAVIHGHSWSPTFTAFYAS